MTRRVIIGLTGAFGSGCTSISKILEEMGFLRISISSILIEKAKEQDIEVSKLNKQERRKVLQDIGNDLRKSDLGALLKICKKQITDNPTKNIVIESVKNPGEIEELNRLPNSYLIAVDTSFEERKTRILSSEYKDNLIQFKKDNSREKDEDIVNGQHLQQCVDLADILINNEKDNKTPREKDLFKAKIKSYIKLMQNPGNRYPSALELWMNNAYSISLQSKCLKRQVGAVIVKEGHLIASGFNDVPKGDNSCMVEYQECFRDLNRGKIKYCALCGKKLGEDFYCNTSNCEYNILKIDKILDKCRSLHAEENAVLQVAKLGGNSLKGAVLYCTTFPCKLCANKIINIGIKEVVYVDAYPDAQSVDLLKNHEDDITVTKFEGVKAAAFYELFKSTNK